MTKDRLQLDPGDAVGDGREPDRFTVRQRLGRGAYSFVFLAHDNLYERDVALKLLLLGEGAAERDVALNEARALARVRHPNVVTVYEVIRSGSVGDSARDGRALPPFLVMEYVEGEELAAMLDGRTEGLEPAEALRIMRPVAAALVAAHRAGVVHRDLKPANIMVGDDGVVKLIDFGVADRAPSPGALVAMGQDRSAMARDDGAVARDGRPARMAIETGSIAPAAGGEITGGLSIVGTPYFLAPELWGGTEADAQTDIFAFGVTLFRSLTLGYPAAEDQVDRLRARMLSEEPLPSVAALRPGLPVLLAEVVDRALDLDRGRRHRTADELLRGLEQATQHGAHALPDAPYVGLKPFSTAEQGVFFGREDEIARLTGRLRRERLAALVGESGAGKSSLALAGVVPAVERGGLDDGIAWVTARISPGRRPLEALAGAVAPLVDGHDAASLAAELATEEEILDQWPRLLRPAGGGRRQPRRRSTPPRGLLLVVDQLEELLTVCDDLRQRERFARALAAAATSTAPLRVVVTVRSDYLARLGALAGLAPALEAVHLVRPLDGEALRAAVVAPARAFGYSFESEAMVDEIVDEVAGRPGSLPLLQFALEQLWAERDEEARLIPYQAMERMGGVGAALAEAAERVYLALEGDGLGELTNRVLLDLLTPEGTKRSRGRAELIAAASEQGSEGDGRRAATVLDALQRARLLVGDEQALELAHEALVDNWPRLGRLIEWTRTEREIADSALNAARLWDRHGRPRDLLWRGNLVQLADQLNAVRLPPLATTFIRASQVAVRRTTRARQAALFAVAVLLVLSASAFSVYALKKNEQLKQQEIRLETAQLQIKEARNRPCVQPLATTTPTTAPTTTPPPRRPRICLFAPNDDLSMAGPWRRHLVSAARLLGDRYQVDCQFPYVKTSPRLQHARRTGVIQFHLGTRRAVIDQLKEALRPLYPQIAEQPMGTDRMLIGELDVLDPERTPQP